MTDAPRKGPGRPEKFTPDVKERYLQYIREGSLPREAARRLDISYKTVQRHMYADRSFKDDIEDAVAEAVEAVESVMHTAALAGEPWAVKDWLAAHNRTKWGKKETVEHVGKIVHELDASQKLTEISDMRRQLAERAETIEAVELERGPDQ